MKNSDPYYITSYVDADDFILEMLDLGKPLEVSLVGVFDEEGRGSRRDIELPFHRDGEYSEQMAKAQGGYHTPAKDIDIVAMYCVWDDAFKRCFTTINDGNKIEKIELTQGDALIFDNKKVTHGRMGEVGDRLLLRIWIKRGEISEEQ